MRLPYSLLIATLLLATACHKDKDDETPDPPEPPKKTLSLSLAEGFVGDPLYVNIIDDSLDLSKPVTVKVGGILFERLKGYHEMTEKQLYIYGIPDVTPGAVEFIIENNGKKFSTSEFNLVTRAIWQSKTALANTNLRYGAVSFAIGNKAYVGTGADYLHTLQDFNAGLYNLYGGLYLYENRTGGFRNDWKEYDSATDQWTGLPNFPGGLRYGAVGFAIGNKGYVGFGHLNDGVSSSSNIFYNDLWEYDPATKTWTRMPDFPGNPRTGATSFTINNKAYVLLGNNGGTVYHKDVWEFDGPTKAWKKLNDFPAAQTAGSRSLSLDGKGYALCTPSGELWEYTVSSDTWTKKATLTGKSRAGASGFAIAGKLYFGFGHYYDPSIPGPTYPDNSTSDFWEYNPATDTWLRMDNSVVREASFSFAIGNNGYVGGGISLRRSGNHRMDAYLVNNLTMFTRR